MISRLVKTQLAVFALLAVIALLITGGKYVMLDKKLYNKPYSVLVDFPTSGGIFTNAEVSYRGVEIGRVGKLSLSPGGVNVELKINKGQKVPTQTRALVEKLSAIGEQYVDLQPMTGSGPYLKDGSRIPRSLTQTPLDENTVLVDLDQLVRSVPKDDLRTTVDELGTAFNGPGPDLQRLVDRGNEVIKAFQSNLPQTIRLIEDGKIVLQTQSDVSGAFKNFANKIANVGDTLRSSDADLRRLLDAGVISGPELSGLLNDIRPTLPMLLGNLITLGQIQGARLPGLDELLTIYPKVISAGFSVLSDPGGGAQFGLVTDQYPVCTQGYSGFTQKEPDDSTTQQPAPLQYTCKEPISSNTDIRGSRNAPRPAGDTTDPLLGGYNYNASYTDSKTGHRVTDAATFDQSSGLVTTADGKQVLLGADGGQAEVLGADSWKYIMLAPVTN